MSAGHVVTLHGAYYTDNFGDILLMDLFRRWIGQHPAVGEVRVPFLTPRAGGIARSAPRRWRSLASSDVLVMGGGGYFGEPAARRQRWGLRMLHRYVAPASLFAALGRPYAIIGVGVGPISNPAARAGAASVARRARRTVVRDAPSRDYLAAYGVDASSVVVAADAALALRRDDIPEAARSSVRDFLGERRAAKRVALHVSQVPTLGARKVTVLDELADVLAGRDDVETVSISDQTGAPEQRRAAVALAERNDDRYHVHDYRDPWTLAALLAEVDLVVTTKLHVGIVAAACGADVLSFPTHVKTPRFYAQIGASDRCTPLHALAEGEAAERLERALTSDPKLVLPQEVRDAACRNRTELHAFLDEAFEGPQR